VFGFRRRANQSVAAWSFGGGRPRRVLTGVRAAPTSPRGPQNLPDRQNSIVHSRTSHLPCRAQACCGLLPSLKMLENRFTIPASTAVPSPPSVGIQSPHGFGILLGLRHALGPRMRSPAFTTPRASSRIAGLKCLIRDTLPPPAPHQRRVGWMAMPPAGEIRHRELAVLAIWRNQFERPPILRVAHQSSSRMVVNFLICYDSAQVRPLPPPFPEPAAPFVQNHRRAAAMSPSALHLGARTPTNNGTSATRASRCGFSSFGRRQTSLSSINVHFQRCSTSASAKCPCAPWPHGNRPPWPGFRESP